MARKLKVKIGDSWFTVEVGDLLANPVRVLVDGEPVEVDVDRPVERESPQSGEGPDETVGLPAPDSRVPSAIREFRSPMPGVIVSVSVAEGDRVVTGDDVCVLEAMKMHQVLRADWTGIVRAVHVSPGQQVLDGDLILELE